MVQTSLWLLYLHFNIIRLQQCSFYVNQNKCLFTAKSIIFKSLIKSTWVILVNIPECFFTKTRIVYLIECFRFSKNLIGRLKKTIILEFRPEPLFSKTTMLIQWSFRVWNNIVQHVSSVDLRRDARVLCVRCEVRLVWKKKNFPGPRARVSILRRRGSKTARRGARPSREKSDVRSTGSTGSDGVASRKKFQQTCGVENKEKNEKNAPAWKSFSGFFFFFFFFCALPTE